MLVTLSPTVPMRKVEAATTIKSGTIASYCNSKVNTYYPSGVCLKFVWQIFKDLGASPTSACCAQRYGDSIIQSTSADNIPVGADVFFSGSTTICGCGNRAGHVAIYVGDGYVVHSWGSKVRKEKLSTVMNWKGYTYRGWGYHGGVNVVSGDGPNPIQTSNPDDYPMPTATISTSYNSRGTGVSWVQAILNKTIGTSLSIDGVYGSGTRSAVITFQNRYGLAAEGVVGPATRAKMQEVWNASKVIVASSITVNPTSLTLTTGKSSGKIATNIGPSNTTNKTVTWSTSNKAVATVNNGVVTAVSPGTAKITASTHNGKTAVCTVNVYDPCTITFVNEDGTVLDEQKVDYGKSATAPKNPEKTGYTFAGWNGTYQNVKEDATVTETYTKNTYKVTFKEKD